MVRSAAPKHEMLGTKGSKGSDPFIAAWAP